MRVEGVSRIMGWLGEELVVLGGRKREGMVEDRGCVVTLDGFGSVVKWTAGREGAKD